MKTTFLKNIFLSGVLICSAAACTKDLDREPFYDLTSVAVYQDFANYKNVLAKVYAGYAVSGQQGPAGNADISGLDEGFSNYLRLYFNLQELPTDEAVIGWNDGSLPDFHDMDWTASNEFIAAMFSRVYYQISLTNEFIRETTEEKLSSRGITGANLENARKYRAEARFLRALSYWHALDMFGNVPFVTENDRVGVFFPPQIARADLFQYIESELLEVETELMAPRTNEYGRADQAAAWTLLTKLYLNAQVYTGQAKYTEAVTYAKKVIDAGYTLEPEYSHLFLTDNNRSDEIIFPITFDGMRTTSYGGMTYLVNAALGGNMNSDDFGVSAKWAGLRTTKSIVNLFSDPSGNTDRRANFWSSGQNLEINDIFTFTDGYPIVKYKNVSSTGQRGSDPSGTFPDTDFPMFRLADVYLMYAEAVLRGGTGGNAGTAVQYINQLRERAYKTTAGNITEAQLTLDFILDERARELKWEMHRRTDLIRFNRFTSDAYLWPWKGGVKDGRGVETFRTLYPVPSPDITANPNLKQNGGY